MTARDPALPRCTWARNDALMRDYHDTEWGVPQHDDHLLWEMLMLEGFQAGLSWITVLRKRAAFREAFCGFDPHQVAAFTEDDVQRLLGNPGIIRARAKIEATITGAHLYCQMAAQGESFSDFCWHFTHGQVLEGDGVTQVASTPLSAQISVALKKGASNSSGRPSSMPGCRPSGLSTTTALNAFAGGGGTPVAEHCRAAERQRYLGGVTQWDVN